MPRLMSVAFTTQQVRDQVKTVTRRTGWWLDKHGRRLLVPGDLLTLCPKVMGRKPDEPLERIATVRVVDVRRERLDQDTSHTARWMAAMSPAVGVHLINAMESDAKAFEEWSGHVNTHLPLLARTLTKASGRATT